MVGTMGTMRIFCWSITILILFGWAIGRILHPGNANFPHPFFLVKYSLDIFFVNLALVMFVWPFLINKGVIGANYHDEDELGRAKIFLVLNGMYSPSIILLFVSSFITREAFIPVSLIVLLYCYGYSKNCYVYFIKKGREHFMSFRNGDKGRH